MIIKRDFKLGFNLLKVAFYFFPLTFIIRCFCGLIENSTRQLLGTLKAKDVSLIKPNRQHQVASQFRTAQEKHISKSINHNSDTLETSFITTPSDQQYSSQVALSTSINHITQKLSCRVKYK